MSINNTHKIHCVLESERQKPLLCSLWAVRGQPQAYKKGRMKPSNEGCRWRGLGSLLPVQLSLCLTLLIYRSESITLISTEFLWHL